MDMSSLASAAASLLAAGIGEGMASEAGKTTWQGMTKLTDLVRRKLAGDPRAASALLALRSGSSAEGVTQLAQILQKQLEIDKEFYDSISALIAELNGGAMSRGIIISDQALVNKATIMHDVYGDVNL